MFAFRSVFDSILTENSSWMNKEGESRELAVLAQQILRDHIVNPLRRDIYTPAGNIMKLRNTMAHLDSKFNAEEMGEYN